MSSLSDRAGALAAAPNHQLVDDQPTDPHLFDAGASDCEPADGEHAYGQGADRQRASRSACGGDPDRGEAELGAGRPLKGGLVGPLTVR